MPVDFLCTDFHYSYAHVDSLLVIARLQRSHQAYIFNSDLVVVLVSSFHSITVSKQSHVIIIWIKK